MLDHPQIHAYVIRTCDALDLSRAGMGEPGTYKERAILADSAGAAVAQAERQAGAAGLVVLSVALAPHVEDELDGLRLAVADAGEERRALTHEGNLPAAAMAGRDERAARQSLNDVDPRHGAMLERRARSLAATPGMAGAAHRAACDLNAWLDRHHAVLADLEARRAAKIAG